MREVPAIIYEIVDDVSDHDEVGLQRSHRMHIIDYDPREFDEHVEELHQTKEVVLVKKQRPKSLMKMALKDVVRENN